MLLPAGCHGNLPVLNLFGSSAFSPLLEKNYALDRKMTENF